MPISSRHRRAAQDGCAAGHRGHLQYGADVKHSIAGVVSLRRDEYRGPWSTGSARREQRKPASSWYGGGTSVIDFNDPANAFEIAYYDAQVPVPSSTWSTYWFNGFIYANDIPRGFDVLKLSDFAGANTVKFDYLNPQVQETRIP